VKTCISARLTRRGKCTFGRHYERSEESLFFRPLPRNTEGFLASLGMTEVFCGPKTARRLPYFDSAGRVTTLTKLRRKIADAVMTPPKSAPVTPNVAVSCPVR
jgi:hypothetical protein